MSTTPAFSPIPTRSFSRISSVVFSAKCRKWTFDDLYEQCSDHTDRVHRELGARRAAAEDLADPLVLVLLQAELDPGLLVVGSGPAFATVSTCGAWVVLACDVVLMR